MSKSAGRRVSAFAKLNGKSKRGLEADATYELKRKAAKKTIDKATSKSSEVSKTKGKVMKKKFKEKSEHEQELQEEPEIIQNEIDKEKNVTETKKKGRNNRILKEDKCVKDTEHETANIKNFKTDKKQKGNKRKHSTSSDRNSDDAETRTDNKSVQQDDSHEIPAKKKGKRSSKSKNQSYTKKAGRFERVGKVTDELNRSDLSICISDESDSDVIVEPDSSEVKQTDEVIITRCSMKNKNFSNDGSPDQDGYSPYSIRSSDGNLVILPHPSEYIFKGKASITMVTGTVAIQGYQLQPNKPIKIFSPECNSLLTLKTVQSESRIKETVSKCSDFCKLNNQKQISEIESVLKKLKTFAVLYIQRNVSNTLDLVTSFESFSRLFSVELDGTDVNKKLVPLGASLLEESKTPCMEINSDLEDVLQLWSGKGDKDLPKSILVCGGKDSGKSTTNRLLLNSALSKCYSSKKGKEVLYYLELDVGQSEFTPPGCVSLVKVTEPLLGPPFCHQKEPVFACAYGGVTPSDDPDRYTACVQACVARYRKMGSPGRLVVNTMGWMRGLGYQLLVDAVNLIQPQYIIQLSSARKNRNTETLTEGFFYHTSWSDLSMDRNIQPVYRTPDYEPTIIHLENPVAPVFMSRYQASDHRNLSMLSHLCADLDPAMTLTSIPPYTVRWGDVAVHVCGADVPQSQMLYALNGSLVTLCKTDITKAKETVSDGPLFFRSLPVCEWLGYGTIRGIDPEKKLFYLVTTLPKDKLDLVNTFLKGSVLIPGQLVLSQKCSEMAYVDTYKKSFGSSAVKPRHHMPRKGLRPKDGGSASN